MNATQEIRKDSSQISFEERTGHADESVPIPYRHKLPEGTTLDESKAAVRTIDALIEDLKANPAPHRVGMVDHRVGMVEHLEAMKAPHEDALGVNTRSDGRHE
jgi:hypothetical protein